MSIEKPTNRERQQAAAVLRKAADLIRPPGKWTRLGYRAMDAYCAVGAICEASGNHVGLFTRDLDSGAASTAVKALAAIVGGGESDSVFVAETQVVRFNDSASDKRKVLRRMEKAAKMLEGASS